MDGGWRVGCCSHNAFRAPSFPPLIHIDRGDDQLTGCWGENGETRARAAPIAATPSRTRPPFQGQGQGQVRTLSANGWVFVSTALKSLYKYLQIWVPRPLSIHSIDTYFSFTIDNNRMADLH